MRGIVGAILVFLAAAVLTAQQVDVSSVGPAIGVRVPDFSGPDQFGRTRDLQSVLGREGVLLVFFRSADW